MAGTFTKPLSSDFDQSQPSGCSTGYAGCQGVLHGHHHQVRGTITVIDDCTFQVSDWEFDGEGPGVEWWGEKFEGEPNFIRQFPLSSTAIKIGELGTPGNYQTGALPHTNGKSNVTVTIFLISLSRRTFHMEDIAPLQGLLMGARQTSSFVWD
jgi:hypothetical protein